MVWCRLGAGIWLIGLLLNKRPWIFNRNSDILIQENAFENTVCEMAAILSRSQCVSVPLGLNMATILIYLPDAPIHYLKQWWLTMNKDFSHSFQWKLNPNEIWIKMQWFSNKTNIFEYVFKTATMLLHFEWLKSGSVNLVIPQWVREKGRSNGSSLVQEMFYCLFAAKPSPQTQLTFCQFPDNKVHGANMGPIWDRQDQGRSHVGPMNLAIWVEFWQMNDKETIWMFQENSYKNGINKMTAILFRLQCVNMMSF